MLLARSGERPTGLENEDSVDAVWEYEIAKEDGSGSTTDSGFVNVHRGTLLGEYETQPEPQEIILDFVTYIMSVAIDFPLHGTPRPLTAAPLPKDDEEKMARPRQHEPPGT